MQIRSVNVNNKGLRPYNVETLIPVGSQPDPKKLLKNKNV